MNNLVLAFRSLFKKGQNNIIKILSLSTGLAVGLILISKVYFELNYDNFYPDSDRIYMVQTDIQMADDSEMKTYGQVSGAIAPGMKTDIPEVEEATRFTYLGYDAVFFTQDKNRFVGKLIMADSCFFDVLPRKVIAGNAKEIFSRPMQAMVSRSMAEKMGDQVIGKSIYLDSSPKNLITIEGIFEDVPENSHIEYDIIVSLSSIKNYSWDGTQNWIGNDRYIGYVKLRPGVDPKSLAPSILKMQERHQDMEMLKKAGVGLTYSLVSLTKLHSDTPEAKRMVILLFLIAFALIFTAVMNYILIVISTLVGRAKEIAVYKSYGAEEKDIARLVFTETSLHLILSLILSAVMVVVFRDIVEELLSVSLGALFSVKTCLLLLGICLLISLITGFVPAHMLSRIPVASVFRNFRKSRRAWKLILLFIQFVATAFLITLLIVVGRQYDTMVNDDPGYTYENVIYCSTSGVDETLRQNALDRLSRLPEIASVATCSSLPIDSHSGNNVSLPGDDRELFNIADFYNTDENYLPLLQVPIVEGKGFDRETSVKGHVLVSQSFADRMVDILQWKDGVVGKDLIISEHGLVTVVGVYRDFRLEAIGRDDKRPSVMFYSDTPSSKIVIKLHHLNAENIQRVYDELKAAMPDKDIDVMAYKDSMVKLYTGSRLFRNSVLIGGIVALIIALIGLIGYTNNEMNRRSAEIAIRKINGATLPDLLRLFVKDIIWISLPALILGGVGAAFAARKWMENFTEKVSLTPLFFVLCGLIVLAIILSVVILNCMRVANRNPVDSINSD